LATTLRLRSRALLVWILATPFKGKTVVNLV
jgi:hypothetical protein